VGGGAERISARETSDTVALVKRIQRGTSIVGGLGLKKDSLRGSPTKTEPESDRQDGRVLQVYRREGRIPFAAEQALDEKRGLA